jgi:Tn3 transposase DDE domain
LARRSSPRRQQSGRATIADGTHVKLRENNLIGSRHIRYGGYGGIAYHRLMKNRSVIQPDTLHADTQGQSEPVFGLCRLLGIKLMPRMRSIGDVTFYRPAASIRYRHIDALFRAEIDWDLIATHARDVFQVVLSIQAGWITPSVLLRKLGTYNRRRRLYRAFREIDRVERTLFLLRFIADTEIRRTIRAETTKIEAFNDFLDWVSFGGPVIKSGDPVEQEKQLKYASLVANAVMLSNSSIAPWRFSLRWNIPTVSRMAKGTGRLLIDNRNMNKAPQMHERQNIVQRITLLAVGHNRSHYGRNSDVAENSMALGHLPYDVGFCNDTRHHALAVTNDQKRSMCAAQQLRCFCEQGVSLDRNQPFPGDRQYTRDTHWICPDWMLAVCTHRLIRRITRTRTPLFIGDHTRLPLLSDNPDAPEPEGVLSEHIWQTNIIAT